MKKFTKFKVVFPDTKWKKAVPWFKTYAFLLLEIAFVFFIVSLIISVLLGEIYDRDLLRESRKEGSREISDQELLLLEQQYSLDGDFWARYVYFMTNFWTGNLISMSIQRDAFISDIVDERFLTSFKIGIFGLIIGVSGGIILGLLAGRKPGGILDKIVSSYIVVILSIPVFGIGLVIQLIAFESGNTALIYDANNVSTWILPIITLALPTVAGYARYLKTTVGEELRSSYVNLAKSKGASSIRIAFVHLLKPSLYPIVTFLPAAVLFTFTGAIITESVFSIPGSGVLFLDAIQSRDIWVIGSITMIYTALSLVAFIIRDLAYPLIDPLAKTNVLFKRGQ